MIIDKYDMNDIYNINQYGKYYGHKFTIVDNKLIVSKCFRKPIDFIKESQDYYLQNSIDTLASKICYDVLIGKNLFKYRIDSIINNKLLNDNIFFSIVNKYLNKYNKKIITTVEEEDTYLGPVDITYLEIITISKL
jgi:hypothetical protein